MNWLTGTEYKNIKITLLKFCLKYFYTPHGESREV